MRRVAEIRELDKVVETSIEQYKKDNVEPLYQLIQYLAEKLGTLLSYTDEYAEETLTEALLTITENASISPRELISATIGVLKNAEFTVYTGLYEDLQKKLKELRKVIDERFSDY